MKQALESESSVPTSEMAEAGVAELCGLTETKGGKTTNADRGGKKHGKKGKEKKTKQKEKQVLSILY